MKFSVRQKVIWDKAQLVRVWKQRQRPSQLKPLETGVKGFMKRVVYPRQRKLSAVSEAWQELLPEELLEHSCLEDFKRGRLMVLVDSAAHLYELQLLLREGLADQLRERCPGVGLTTVQLKRGVWYVTDAEGHRIARF